LVLIICLTVQVTSAQTNDKPFSINESPLPKPATPVLDNAGILDSGTKKRLEDKIIEFQKQSNPSVELAVAIVKTTGDRPIFDYSMAVARGWGIGSREQDNPGALLFVAIDDRKYFTQVSSDLEDELPDGLVGSLQRQYLVPPFKTGNYSKGIEDTIDAYIRTIKQQQSGAPVTGEKTDGFRGYDDVQDFGESNCSGIFICLIIIGIIIFIAIANSGGGGGGGGGRRRRKHKSTGDDIVGDIVTGILAGLISGGSGGGSSSGDWGSGGSSWGGGSSGGGWGGFGGGGDFGGGGAGGGW
jgi:uncharacterized protein